MFKNFIQKAVSTIIVLSMMLTGLSLTPIFASADNGLHLGVGANIGARVNVKKDVDHDDDKDKSELNIQDETSLSITKTARTTFHNAIKSANTNYKTAQKNAKTEFKASLKTATDQTARIVALKTYFSSLLVAFKVKASAIEAAFQAFIDMRFNQNPTANAQSVTLTKNSLVNITLTGSDPEGLPLSYVVVTSTTHGTLSGTAPSLTYTPAIDFTGNDSFTFKVNDGSLDSTLKTVSIVVNP